LDSSRGNANTSMRSPVFLQQLIGSQSYNPVMNYSCAGRSTFSLLL